MAAVYDATSEVTGMGPLESFRDPERPSAGCAATAVCRPQSIATTVCSTHESAKVPTPALGGFASTRVLAACLVDVVKAVRV
ncbi:MAG: hypothetical protein GXP36_01765 [Actinobacteria bacterium]|nr:hypothetical protein [Actinomycetota bacterium]